MRPQCPRKDGPEESPKRTQRMKRLAARENPGVGPEPEGEVSPQAPQQGTSSSASAGVAQPKAPPQGFGPKISRLSLSEPLGLLDGGATHALRPADNEQEYARATPLKVGLATGETNELRITKGGTLVTMARDTQPILPLGVPVRLLGMSVVWRENHCDIIHPKRGRIKVMLHRGCPEVPRALCVSLIRELEAKLGGNELVPTSIQVLGAMTECEVQKRLCEALRAPDCMQALKVWFSEVYPQVPIEVVNRVVPQAVPNADDTPFNRHTRRKVDRGRVLLHLFSGSQSWSHPSFNYTLNVEKDRGWDVLDDATFGYIMGAVMRGCIAGILAGPPCRTWSRLRTRADDGPPPLRDREGIGRFGFATLESTY